MTNAPAANKPAKYSVLQLAQPAASPRNIGIFLLDLATGRLYKKLRRDWSAIADPESAQILELLDEDFAAKIDEMGGDMFLRSLEDSLSNFLLINDRRDVSVSNFQKALDRLYEEHVQRTEVIPFVTHVPLYSLRAAATKFGEDMEVEAEGWVRAPERRKLDRHMFAGRVVGRSMEPLIPDGSLCLFHGTVVGSRQNKRLLIQRMGVTDSSAEFTVKKYTSKKVAIGEDQWRHIAIILKPLNPEFEAMEFGPEDEHRQFRVIAEFVQVLEGIFLTFAARLTKWYDGAQRDLPWRNTRDPYRILVSEIMLQQTRAQAVIPYYERFLESFPTARDLAGASETEVLRRWSGLGYYQRARNLHKAARQIVERGAFPREYEAIRELPGVGAYTAAAVASIAFGSDRAVVDGNVMRVIARFTGDAADIGVPATRIRFEKIAGALLDPHDPGRFNQAMMELGATVCLPRNPLCLLCPVSADCQARAQGKQLQLPVKLKRARPVRVDATLLIVERAGRILLWRRNPDARRLGGFWELPSSEELPKARKLEALGSFRHSITNHNYTFTIVKATVSVAASRFQWFDRAQLQAIPLSTTTRKALALIQQHH